MSFVMYSTTRRRYSKRTQSQLPDLGTSFAELNIEELPAPAEIVDKVNGGHQTVQTLLSPDGPALTNPTAQKAQEKHGSGR